MWRLHDRDDAYDLVREPDGTQVELEPRPGDEPRRPENLRPLEPETPLRERPDIEERGEHLLWRGAANDDARVDGLVHARIIAASEGTAAGANRKLTG